MMCDSTMARANKKKHFYFGIVFLCVNKFILTFRLISMVGRLTVEVASLSNTEPQIIDGGSVILHI